MGCCRHQRVVCGGIVAVASAVFALAAKAGTYVFVEVPPLSENYCSAEDLNDAGQVVGWSNTSSNAPHAFLWDAANGTQELGTLGGYRSEARRINEAGQVVGWSTTASGNWHAFLWDAVNGMQDLGTLGGDESYASAINSSGQVVGKSDTATGDQHAFLWDAVNGMQDLGTLGGAGSFAYAINDSGQVVGLSDRVMGEAYQRHAFVWDAVNGMQELGTLGGFRSKPSAINSSGQVVGQSRTATGDWHAFLWDAVNGMQDLGTLNPSGYSFAEDINDAGQVAVESDDIGCLWDPVNGLQALGVVPHVINNVTMYRINDAGQILGRYTHNWGYDDGIGAFEEPWPCVWNTATSIEPIDLAVLLDSRDVSLFSVTDINNHGIVLCRGKHLGSMGPYVLLPGYSVTTSVVGGGSLNGDPAGPEYASGAEITLSADAESGWRFQGWSGGLTGSENPATITVTSDLAIVATFSVPPQSMTITTTVLGGGTVSRDSPGPEYVRNTNVTLRAHADSGWRFLKWDGDLFGSENPATIRVTSDLSIRAIFVPAGTQCTGGNLSDLPKWSSPAAYEGLGTIAFVTLVLLCAGFVHRRKLSTS